MSKTLSSINTAADTFQNWIDRTNSIITLLDTETVTANTTGALTSGNGFVNGFFGANTLVATNIRGGNVTTNSVLTFQTNTTFSANVLISQQLTVGNSSVNVVVNSSMIIVGGSNVATVSSLASVGTTGSITLTGNSSQVIDNLVFATFRSAEYIISANNNTANAYQISKILVIHDGSTSYVTEYGTMYTNTAVIAISAGANATHVLVNCTPVDTNTTIKFIRFALDV